MKRKRRSEPVLRIMPVSRTPSSTGVWATVSLLPMCAEMAITPRPLASSSKRCARPSMRMTRLTSSSETRLRRKRSYRFFTT